MAAPEYTLHGVLTPVCPHVYPDQAPDEQPQAPYVVWQQIGGTVISTLNDPADLCQARIQIACWAPRRLDANQIMRGVAAAMRAATVFTAKPIGELTAASDPVTQLRGARQDFSVWYRP